MAFRDFPADPAEIDRNPAVERLMTPNGAGRPDNRLLHRLGREIVSGVFPADTRMPDEASMLDSYGVTRTGLREAYAQLTAKGMIVAKTRVGTSVTPPSFWNMLDPDVLLWHLDAKPLDEIAMSIYPLRRMVEPGAAALAAQVRTDAELARLEQAYEQMKSSGRDEEALIMADLRFHLEIISATHNPFIGAFNTLLNTVMRRTLSLGWRGVESAALKPARLLQHFDVLEAIRQQNPDMARMRMEILIDDSLQDVVEALEADNRERRPAGRKRAPGKA
ncbi:FadR/GntR family transcriptional regulator [Devosia sp. FKR38]|uniref:FadR/GntR family transcriptional regulator n=1 Tax=Devosia sp. FKR38 TaxID=2562312 RepID=UPI0010C0B390|nr:FadR/GntR family transcriptional regulator [Devosia sp. FKR38]